MGPRGLFTLGDHSGLNHGTMVRADERISVGADCLIGSRVMITDRFRDRRGPVTIEDGVWLAHGVTVLPGVTIGRGSVVSAGTVVDRDVPAGSLAFGAPLQFRRLHQNNR